MSNTVLFTHAYFLGDDPKEQAIMKPYPPLGILYLSAWLERHGVDNRVFDSTFSDKDTQKKYVLAHQPRILAVYTNLMTKLNVLELLRFVNTHTDLQDTVVVLGGPDVTHNAEKYLAAGADAIVVGEGEETMLELARSVLSKDGKRWHDIPGLVFSEQEKGVIRTPPRAKIPDIDHLPFPDRSKIELERYLSAWKSRHGKSAVSVSTQRGCPYTCRWCSTAVYGQSYRRRSPARVVDELQFLQAQYQPDTFWFVDDVFTVSHKWLRAFVQELRQRMLTISFECITRADRLNPEVIGLLREAGCFRVWIGAESGSQRIIDAMDRRVDVEQVQEMIIETRRQGIEAGTFIMLGYPGETEQDIMDTLDHLKKSDPDLFTITVTYPIKGTGLYDDVQDMITTAPPWEGSTDRDIDFRRTYSRQYYHYAVRWLVNRVYWHKCQSRDAAWTGTAMRHWLKSAVARAGMRYEKIRGAGWRLSG